MLVLKTDICLSIIVEIVVKSPCKTSPSLASPRAQAEDRLAVRCTRVGKRRKGDGKRGTSQFTHLRCRFSQTVSSTR